MTDPLTGEHLALDLVNTRPSVGDLLATPADLRHWLILQRGRLRDEPVAERDVAQVRELRELVAVAVSHLRAGTAPPDEVLRALTQAQRMAPAYRELSWRDGAVAALPRRSGTPGERLVAQLADAAADLLAGPDAGRIRQCEGHDCVMLFVPAHPRRRWCSTARCGNRARVARHYQRHKPA
ncbi:CGNR zinc finger domain-containing protein [Nonomuraea endophytica]|uniref:Putative RNA-binding Zn ribbon-like protein n=1 Tax=Nonomuraea endophytica TaxID=714136 RepID=A0A7W8AG29_9ACTN|nr:ABATE domain-containing protein [Nonomuraea endophytica]MBB5084500.1 putative RNA-binding Zn ribbon-like protein [Nonomuraea endophytica]